MNQTASSSRGPETKPNHPCHVVTLRSEKQLESVVRKRLSSEEIKDLEEVEDDVFLEDILPPSTDTQSPYRSTQPEDPTMLIRNVSHNGQKLTVLDTDASTRIQMDRHPPCVIMENTQIQLEPEESIHGVEDLLVVPSGPLTRARAKAFQNSINGLLTQVQDNQASKDQTKYIGYQNMLMATPSQVD